jgi:hypothetical protein
VTIQATVFTRTPLLGLPQSTTTTTVPETPEETP